MSGTASNDVISLDWTQTPGTTLDQSSVPKPKTKVQLWRDRRRRALDSNCPWSGHEEEHIAGPQ